MQAETVNQLDERAKEYRSAFGSSALFDAMRLITHAPDKLLIAEGYNTTQGDYARVFTLDAGGTWTEHSADLQDFMTQAAVRWTAAVNEAVMGNKISPMQAAAVLRDLKRCTTQAGRKEIIANIPNALIQLRHQQELPKSLIVCKVEELDTSREHIGAQNGVVDLTVGIVLSPEVGKLFKVTKKLPDAFDIEAKSEVADALIETPGLNDEETYSFLWQSLAWALRGFPMEAKRFYALYDAGAGNSGKSTLAKVIVDAFAPYAAFADRNLLKVRKGNDKRTSEFAVFSDARIVFAEETGDGMDTGFIKHITGSATNHYWVLYEGSAARPITASLFTLSNDVPQVNLNDDAMLTRFTPIQFERIPDSEIRNDVVTQQDALFRQAIVAHVVSQGMALEAPPLLPPAIAVEKKDVAHAAKSEAGRFFVEHYVKTGARSDCVSVQEVYQAAQDSGMESEDIRTFSKDLHEELGRASFRRRRMNGTQLTVIVGWRSA